MSDSGSASAPVRRFTPPNTFRAKVPSTGGISLDEMQEACDTALSELESESTDWMQGDVEKLAAELAQATKAPPEELAGHIDTINKITHDLKSLAGQFNFPMIGQVGNSLCDFIGSEEDYANVRLDVVRVHVDAIVVILANGLAGEGGEAGAHLLQALKKAVDKARAQQHTGATPA